MKVAYICHNHPAVRPGGAEAYAFELYEAVRDRGVFETIFLAKGGPPLGTVDHRHAGSMLAAVNSDPNQFFLNTDHAAYDYFYGTSRDKDLYLRDFAEFLLAARPDVVHFQHTHFLGFDMIRLSRNVLPDAPIVYTLHEFIPICHNNGQMLRTSNNEPCRDASPRRCHECFPDITPEAFFRRRRFIQSHFALVDLFLAPSRFLLERYVDWGIPRERIRFEEYGRKPMKAPTDTDTRHPRNRFGFFGQFTPYKGVHVLMKAMRALAGEPRPTAHVQAGGRRSPRAAVAPRVWLFGANLEMQPQAFQKEFKALLETSTVTFAGPYRTADVPRLMENIDWVVVPSIWWENSPLVIQEAFMNRRPVICSDIGGMAEKVTPGVNGLHFRAGDPESLARTLVEAANTPGLWKKLQKGVPEIYPMDDHIAALTGMYESLLVPRSKEVAHVV